MTGQNIQVLLVEDSPTDALLVEEELQNVQDVTFIITHVERLGEAIQKLKDQLFGLVLLDLNLPDSEGFETFVKLRDAAQRTPVVILSGRTDVMMAVRAVQAGAQDYLVKGNMAEQYLARAIHHAIERKRSEDALHELGLVLEQRNTELTLRNQELLGKTAFFEAQVNSALDGILVVDKDGKKILQNQRMVSEPYS